MLAHHTPPHAKPALASQPRCGPSHTGFGHGQGPDRIAGALPRPYLILNLAGSAVLAADAAAGSQWGFLLLEGEWAVVSLVGLA
jgi:hypothetical protein